MTSSLLITLLMAGLALLGWLLADVLLLGFGGVLVGVLLRHLAGAASQKTGLSSGWALAAVILAILLAATLFVIFLGPRLTAQFELLWQSIPAAWKQVEETLSQYGWGRFLLDRASDPGDRSRGSVLSVVSGTVWTVFGAVGDALLVFIVGMFLAADPALYRRGVVCLVSPTRRQRAREVLDALGGALWHWILGQLIVMACIGAITAAGLALLGIPLALPLGVLAGLLNFVPYLGPLLSAVPAILIAFAQSPADALYTALLFLLIQNVEGYALTPLLQKRATAIPPALGLVTIVGAGTLFGIYGILFATPLLLAIMVLVRMLYVEDVLGDRDAGRAK